MIEDLRRTNLAHLLAISGLHMGLLMTVVFGLLRMICVVIPIGHIRWHARSIAAFGAIMAWVAYLGLSGNSIATQRAFVMIACFFGAAILGACGAYYFDAAARGALFPRISNVVRSDDCISQCV